MPNSLADLPSQGITDTVRSAFESIRAVSGSGDSPSGIDDRRRELATYRCPNRECEAKLVERHRQFLETIADSQAVNSAARISTKPFEK